MNQFSNSLKVVHIHDSYVLAWSDPDGNIRQEQFPSRLIQQSFAKVLRKLLNGGFGHDAAVFFADRKPRKELKEFILSH